VVAGSVILTPPTNSQEGERLLVKLGWSALRWALGVMMNWIGVLESKAGSVLAK